MSRFLPSAAAGLVAATVTLGCGDGDTSMMAASAQAADSIAVAPRTARLEDVGATQAFTATVFREGQPVAANPAWSTDDFTVAIVGPDGIAVAQGPGQTAVIASVGEVADSAVLTVDFVSTPPGAPRAEPPSR